MGVVLPVSRCRTIYLHCTLALPFRGLVHAWALEASNQGVFNGCDGFWRQKKRSAACFIQRLQTSWVANQVSTMPAIWWVAGQGFWPEWPNTHNDPSSSTESESLIWQTLESFQTRLIQKYSGSKSSFLLQPLYWWLAATAYYTRNCRSSEVWLAQALPW